MKLVVVTSEIVVDERCRIAGFEVGECCGGVVSGRPAGGTARADDMDDCETGKTIQMDLTPLRKPEEHDHQAVDGEQRVAVQFSYYAPDLLDPHSEDLVDSDLRVFV